VAEEHRVQEIPPILEKFIEKGLKLPAWPTLLGQLGEVIRDPKKGPNDVANLLKTDPSLTSAVLKVSNSALYGASRQISSVDAAIVRLGFKEVWNIVVGLKSKEFLNAPNLSVFSSWLYEHSLRLGFLFRHLSKDINPRFEEFYFTAGVLHDIGRMVLAQVDNEYAKYALNLPTLLKEDPSEVMAEETRRWGSDHAEIGAALAEFWNLPKPLVTMIREHHRPSLSDRIAILMQLSDLWSVILTPPTKANPKLYGALLDMRICLKARIQPDAAQKLGEQVDQEVQAVLGTSR
jgi:putative nucleotidyltransferase with HDIG domain